VSWANSWCFPIRPRVRFISVLGNTVGAGYNFLDLLVSRFLFPIRYLVTKSDLRCFVALAGILPAGKDTSLLVGLTLSIHHSQNYGVKTTGKLNGRGNIHSLYLQRKNTSRCSLSTVHPSTICTINPNIQLQQKHTMLLFPPREVPSMLGIGNFQ